MSASAAIELEGLRRTFVTEHGGVAALDGLDLRIEAGSFSTLFGPSGCGKTTALRAIAGLEVPDAGTIRIAGTTVDDVERRVHVPTERRSIGMVFQSLALWPHLDARGNVAYPLRVAGVRRGEALERADRMLGLVDLAGLGSRRIAQLSGGQQQRVAIARALVREPDVLLLDEPFSALDAHLREQLGQELKELQRRLGLTTVYVTHDRHEAIALSDSVAVLRSGSLVQAGPPERLYAQPRTAFVARLLGPVNVVALTSTGAVPSGTATLEASFGPLDVSVPVAPPPQRRVHTAMIRPQEVVLETTADEQAVHRSAEHADPHATRATLVDGAVERVRFRGAWAELDVALGDDVLSVRAPATARPEVGTTVRLRLPTTAVLLLEGSDEATDAPGGRG